MLCRMINIKEDVPSTSLVKMELLQCVIHNNPQYGTVYLLTNSKDVTINVDVSHSEDKICEPVNPH